MNSFYRQILRTAWHAVWHHKALWVFGVFAAIVAEEIESIFRNYVIFTDQSFSIDSLRSFFDTGLGANLADIYRSLIVTSPVRTMIALLIILAIIVIIVWLVIISQSALVYAANGLMKKNVYRWNESFGAGVAFFWPVLAVNAILKIVDYVMLVLVGIVLSYLLQGSTFLFGAILILLTFAASLIIAFLGKYALGYIVLKNEPVLAALKKSWTLFKANWLISVEMSLLLFLISIVVGLGLLLVAVLVAVPFLVLIWIFTVSGLLTGTQVLFNAGTLIILLIILTVGGGLAAFRYTSWTILFTRLIEGQGQSKIERLADFLVGRRDNKKTA